MLFLVVDEKCQNVSIGEFLCPSDLLEAKTTTAAPTPTTVITEPQTTANGSTPLPNTTTATISTPVSSTDRIVEATQPSSTPLSTTQGSGSSEPRQAQLESENIRRELCKYIFQSFKEMSKLCLGCGFYWDT